MPPFRKVRPLRSLTAESVAKRLHKTLVYLDSIWNPTPNISPGSTPTNSPSVSPMVSPIGGRSTAGILPPLPIQVNRDPCLVSVVRDWLFQIPLHLVEDVIRMLLIEVEKIVHEDKDCKLILTLINIERTRPSDFFFGVHSLFRMLAPTAITKLPFSTKTWYCLSEFEQLTTCDHLLRVMIDSFPLLNSLTQVNLAYVASDKLLYLIAKYCRQLEELNVDQCHQVTDRGVKMLAGNGKSSTTTTGTSVEPSTTQGTSSYYGCKNLQYLSLQGCTSVNDQTIWYLMTHCKKLQVLRYHQSYSVAEILCNELRKLEERQLPKLVLQNFDHPFPYGLNIPEEEVTRVSKVCPNIKVLNLVSLDNCLPAYSQFSYMTKATIEMEDAFGMGLYKFLETSGKLLTEFTISCGSDDSTLLDGGGRSFELFNVGLKLAGRFCPELTMLSISGCGLVTNGLLEHMRKNRDLFLRNNRALLTKLRTLILLTYHDVEEMPIQTCEEELLFIILKDCPDLECLSLEGNFSNFLSDRFFAKVMSTNPFGNLRIFDVQGTQVPLTIATANCFLRLPSLQELRVSCWRLSEQEYKNLDDTVRMSGWDLRLSRRSTAQHIPNF